MPPAVRTRRATAVALPTGVDHEPLPAPGHRVLLSPFNVYWAALPPVRRVFLFAPPPPPANFADVASALRSSLAAVLPAFHPFAGELVYNPAEPRAVSVVCGDGAGVAFVEAETELDFARLVEEGAEHDVDALQQLVPDIRREELPAPVMATQVTEFIGAVGGIAVGVTIHHTAADGRGLWRFLEMWTAAAAAIAGFKTMPVAGEPASPLHDRRLVSFEGDEELARIFLRQVAPDLPRTVPKQDPSPGPKNQLSRRTFTLSSSVIQRLKQQLTPAPSTFVAVVAHGWVSIARASGFTDGAPVLAVFLADLRAHMSPRVPEAYVGNCLALCTVAMGGAELTGQDGPARACLAIREAVAEVRRDPLADRGRWFSKFAAIPRGRAVIMAGSPWFPAYGVDFGLGCPVRAELASMNHDGEMVLVAGREAGSVQASVALAPDKMPAFRKFFVIDT
ncbi:hypothetical protein HU200_023590 [Digitaria exilis]|uniref:Uncharacterized protein n=1 Tax=Digitaria exilis TaxID=1010633 RepID=A0A835EYB5_9POAL|nr:hypothetical protein HU200_023590 [Digitaria exilis]CAB3499818.1 unnamed protein product [Digitaria exilis]